MFSYHEPRSFIQNFLDFLEIRKCLIQNLKKNNTEEVVYLPVIKLYIKNHDYMNVHYNNYQYPIS